MSFAHVPLLICYAHGGLQQVLIVSTPQSDDLLVGGDNNVQLFTGMERNPTYAVYFTE